MLSIRNTHLVHFGGKVVGANIVNWCITNSDNLFVGRACGVTALGLYSRSFTLVNLPEAGIVSTLQAVLFPAYSRTQKQMQSLRRVYLASVSIVGMLTLPLFAVVAVIPHAVIFGIYGARWVEAIPVVVPLALAMPLDSIMSLAGPVLYGVGKVERELWPQLATAIGMIGMMLAMSRISFVAVGWGVLGIYLLRMLLVTRAALRTLELRSIDIWMALRAATFVALSIALIVKGIDFFLLAPVAHMGLRLAIDGTVAAAGFGLLLIASVPLWTEQTRQFLVQASTSSQSLARSISFLSRSSLEKCATGAE
jgi:PST family polysaccharide transporter